MITEQKDGKIIITLETKREAQLVRAALGSVTVNDISEQLKKHGYDDFQQGETSIALSLYARLGYIV